MAFTVKFSNTNLPKRPNLLRSKGDFAGKSGRIAPNSIQTCVQGGLPRRKGAHAAELASLALVRSVWPAFARIGDWVHQRKEIASRANVVVDGRSTMDSNCPLGSSMPLLALPSSTVLVKRVIGFHLFKASRHTNIHRCDSSMRTR